MGKVVKKILPIAGAVLGSAILPGIGTALGSTLGAGTLGSIGGALGGAVGGGVGGGGLKGALTGGLGGGLFGGAGSLAGAAGLGAAGTGALTRGIQGAALGGIGGGLKGALTGGGLGAIGGFLGAGGTVPGLGSLGGQLGAGGMGPPTPPTGIIGKVGALAGIGTPGNTGLTIGGQPMKLGSLLGVGGDLLGLAKGSQDFSDIEEIYRRQAAMAEQRLNPYAAAGEAANADLMGDPLTALRSDPGYQFRLGEGQNALERSFAAQGLGQSGAALKAAQEFGQGLADQTYQDYFNRQSSIANRGLGAAQGLGSIYGNAGDAMAMALAGRSNLFNQGLSGLFGGGGLDGGILQGLLNRRRLEEGAF